MNNIILLSTSSPSFSLQTLSVSPLSISPVITSPIELCSKLVKMNLVHHSPYSSLCDAFNCALHDLIFNCGGSSVAFVFVPSFDSTNISQIFGRIQKLKLQFAHLYVVCTLPTKEQNDLFVRSYFKSGMELGKPPFILVKDLEMGFEKMVRIAYSRGVCKREDVTAKLKAQKAQSVQTVGVFQRVVTSIPGIDSHDANALNQAIGSIEAIAKESKQQILENTDLSSDKAELLSRFFRDPKFYLSPKIN